MKSRGVRARIFVEVSSKDRCDDENEYSFIFLFLSAMFPLFARVFVHINIPSFRESKQFSNTFIRDLKERSIDTNNV